MKSPAPVFARQLTAMKGVLAKGEAHAVAHGTDPDAMVQLRLAADMLPLAAQVGMACDNAKGATYRLAGREVPSMADGQTTFAQLRERIDATIALIAELADAEFEAAEGRTITMTLRSGEMSFPASDYLWGYALPNFFFHATTTYAILRANGVEIGKRDFLGG